MKTSYKAIVFVALTVFTAAESCSNHTATNQDSSDSARHKFVKDSVLKQAKKRDSIIKADTSKGNYYYTPPYTVPK